MNTAYSLETINDDFSYLLSRVQSISKNSKILQTQLMEKYLKIIRLQRRFENIRKVEEKLRLIGTIKDAQFTLNEFINEGHYTSATQLLLKTQQTLNSKLDKITCLKEYSVYLEKTKSTLSNQLDQEFSVTCHQFIVLNTFTHLDKLVKLLKNNSNLEAAFKIFPKESSYDRLNELIQNKVNTSSLVQSLQDLNKSLIREVDENVKTLIGLLGVHKTDENSK